MQKIIDEVTECPDELFFFSMAVFFAAVFYGFTAEAGNVMKTQTVDGMRLELQEMRLWDWLPSEFKDMVQSQGLTRQLGGLVSSPTKEGLTGV